jgi:flagellar hook-associated protein 2
MAGLSFTGIASGIDTDAIVAALMAIERRPTDRVQRAADLASARLAGLADMRSRLASLRGAEQALRGTGVFAPRPIATSSDPARIVATATGSAVKASFSITVGALARADVRTQATTLASATAADTLHLATGTTSIDVAVAAGDSIGTIAAKINTVGGGVSASVVDGRLRLTSRDTGTANAIALTSDGSLAADLGVTVTLAAQDAQLTVDGIARTSSSNRISEALPGVTLDLRGATAGSPVTVTSDPAAVDAEAVVAKAKAFVTAYNGTVDALRAAIGERPGPAGTGAVGKGAFYADGLYTDLLGNLNRAISETVAGLAPGRNQAATIGLSSGAATGAMSADSLSGRMVLDESRLRDALTSDPAGVAALLGGDAPQGIAARLDAVLDRFSGSSGALGGRVAAETARLAGYRASIDQANVRLAQRESLLRAQFTTMERSLGQLRDLQTRFGSQLDAAA